MFFFFLIADLNVDAFFSYTSSNRGLVAGGKGVGHLQLLPGKRGQERKQLEGAMRKFRSGPGEG